MPGIYSPMRSHGHARPQEGYFDTPPRFPGESETSSYQVADSYNHETRKRSLPGAPPRHNTGNFWNDDYLAYSQTLDAKSPPPLANDRYQLAGGDMYGPGKFGRYDGDYDDYYRLQQQRGQWSIPPTPAPALRQPSANGTVMTPNGTKSWSILGLVGGVAGKLFQFCTVPFRGFQAGSGQKYTVEGQGEIAVRLGLADDPFLYHSAGPVQHTTPGDFPQEDYGVRSIDSLDTETPERPCAKRLRTADNWVVVDDSGETESRLATPRLSERRVPDHMRSPSQIPRPASRLSVTTPAKRPSLIPVSRRSMDKRSFHGSVKATSAHSRQRSYSRQSNGSPVTFEEKAKKPVSPLPKESQRLINKVKREEMEDDARMRRMSSQMSAMLREAKEALGSKFEVEDYDDDDDDDESYGGTGSVKQPTYFPRFS